MQDAIHVAVQAGSSAVPAVYDVSWPFFPRLGQERPGEVPRHHLRCPRGLTVVDRSAECCFAAVREKWIQQLQVVGSS
eukprot:2573317-Lingulodinium_polyedra.AAC.1